MYIAIDGSGTKTEISFWIATELLAEEGCIVETANDGVACVDMIEKADADYYKMILLDIRCRL